MIHRIKKAGDIHAGKWNGLGGKMEPGESPEECAAREIKEESGLDALSLKLKGFLTFPKFLAGEDWYCFVFVIDRFKGELLSDSSEGQLAWIDDNKLNELDLWEGDYIFLPWLEGEKFFSAKFVYLGGKLAGQEAYFY